MKLYIIGNGFDLYHGLPSKYVDFKSFVKDGDPYSFETIDKYLDYNGDFWSSFENNLKNFNEIDLVFDAMEFYEEFHEGEWDEFNHENYESFIMIQTLMLTTNLKRNLVDWAKQLNIYPIKCPFLGINKDSLFLSFNYTNTLERYYGVKNSSINYIHGHVMGNECELIFGHDLSEPQINVELRNEIERDGCKTSESYYEEITEDKRIERGVYIIHSYYKQTCKPTQQIIQNNKAFWSRLAEIDQVIVVGHSLSDVDLPYFKETLNHVHPDCPWLVTYYDKQDIYKYQTALKSIGLSLDQLTCIKIEGLSTDDIN